MLKIAIHPNITKSGAREILERVIIFAKKKRYTVDVATARRKIFLS